MDDMKLLTKYQRNELNLKLYAESDNQINQAKSKSFDTLKDDLSLSPCSTYSHLMLKKKKKPYLQNFYMIKQS